MTDNSENVVLVEQRDRILIITINRPEAKNAVNAAVSRGLANAVDRLDDDPGLSVGILTGAGGSFSAGMDLKAFARGGKFDGLVWFFQEGIATPVIAALNGSAMGGGFELMLACDLIVAVEDAKLGISEVKRGLFAAGGGTTLADRVPLAAALEMGLTGDPVTAARAQEMGLVNRVVPAERLLPEALDLAGRIAANGPLGVAMTKKLIRQRRWADTDEVMAVFRSADATEGAKAFVERRPPVWTGQ